MTDTPLDPHSPLHQRIPRTRMSAGTSAREPGPVHRLCAWRAGADAGGRVDASAHQSRAQRAGGGCLGGPLVSRSSAGPGPMRSPCICTRRFLSRSPIDRGAAAGIAGLWFLLVAFYNLADAIDSVAHVFGHKLETQHDESRNVAWMGIAGAWRRLARESSPLSIQRQAWLVAGTIRLDLADHPGASRAGPRNRRAPPPKARPSGGGADQGVNRRASHRSLRKGPIRPERSESVAGALSRHEPAAQR